MDKKNGFHSWICLRIIKVRCLLFVFERNQSWIFLKKVYLEERVGWLEIWRRCRNEWVFLGLLSTECCKGRELPKAQL
jgi:hypothetical protein